MHCHLLSKDASSFFYGFILINFIYSYTLFFIAFSLSVSIFFFKVLQAISSELICIMNTMGASACRARRIEPFLNGLKHDLNLFLSRFNYAPSMIIIF